MSSRYFPGPGLKAINDFARFKERIARLLFPARCLVCGRVVGNSLACPGCREKLERCADIRALGADELHEYGIESVDGVFCCFRYEGAAEDIVKRMKFGGDKWLARDAALVMACCFAGLRIEADVVCCVPPYSDDTAGKTRSRLLAKTFAGAIGTRFDERLLIKTRKTPKQHLLGYDERLSNLKNAFRAGRESLGGKRVMIVDDVMTTGRTLSECAAALKAAGAGPVYAAVFAKTEYGRHKGEKGQEAATENGEKEQREGKAKKAGKGNGNRDGKRRKRAAGKSKR